MLVLSAIALFGASALSQTTTQSSAPAPARDIPASKVGTGVIRGRVVGDADGRLLAKARVTASSAAGEVEPVFTDATGRFEILALPAGRYSLTAQKAGYASVRFGSRDPVDPPFLVDVGNASLVDGLEIRLPKTAAISGRIVDDFGDPMMFVAVSAGILESAGSETRFVRVARPQVLTDDRGEYRLGGLLPGRYVLSVSGAVEGAPPLGASVGGFTRTMTWGRTFYPGVASTAQAQTIDLGVGEERTGIDFSLLPHSPARLLLTLRDAEGKPASTVLIILPVDQSLGMVTRTVAFSVQPNANPATVPRAALSVEPGEWIIFAPGSMGRVWRQLSVGSGEEVAVDLVLGSGARITGRVEFEGSAQPPIGNLQIDVRGVGSLAGVGPRNLARTGPTAVKPDGSFEMVDVFGTVEIRPTTLPRGWTLKSVLHNDRDLLDQPLALTGGEEITGVRVVLTDQPSEVAGTIVDAALRPAPGCAVLLFPELPSPVFSPRRTRLQRTDQNGRFDLTDLPPGSYLAAAVPQVDTARWSTQEHLDQFRPSAVRVSVAERERTSVSLTCGTTP